MHRQQEAESFSMERFSDARDALKILLVDDDSTDAKVIERLASRSNQFAIDLRSCRSVEEAAEILSVQIFDVLLVDYWLGSETSISFIHRFARTQSAPLVLLTGLDVPDIRRCAVRAGVAGFLSKDELSIQAIEGVIIAALRDRPSPS
jgi:DNA-binding NarL/FixJ family response regulator